MTGALYLDTSVVLRSVIEAGASPIMQERIRTSPALLTSRLSTVEASRAIHRLRHLAQISESKLVDAEREIEALWARCALWELTPEVCEMARRIAHGMPVRALDALHLATFVLARRAIIDLELLSVDTRLANAARAI